jgi:hypothetical protein
MGGFLDPRDNPRYQTELYQKWDGLACRQDAHRAAQIDNLREAKARAGTNIKQRALDVEELRRMRQMVAERHHKVCKQPLLATWTASLRSFCKCAHTNLRLPLCDGPTQKLPPYDEFTAFGLPSNHGDYEQIGVKECIQFASELTPRPKEKSAQKSKLEEEVSARANRLTPIHPLDRHDHRPKWDVENRKPTPRAYEGSPRAGGASSTRRPLSGVEAYRKVGLGDGPNWLGTNALRLVERTRGAPKYEEQQMLGFLSSRGGIRPRVEWTMSRFQSVGPRF